MDKSELNDSDRSSSKLAHLEKLFLVAQFMSEDADQAALLVDRVYRSSNAETAFREESFSELVRRLISLSNRDESSERGESRQIEILGANHIRRLEAERLLSEIIRRDFLLLDSADKIDLWENVQVLTDRVETLEKDALGRFTAHLAKRLTADELRLYEPFLSRETVADLLASFWEESFVPVPPTLRAVVESGEKRLPPNAQRRARSHVETAEPKRRHPAKRIFWYTWVIVGATIIGYLITRVGQSPPVSNDFLELSLEVLDDIDITFRTSSAEQSERFIRDRFGWRLTTPEITGAELVGVSLTEIRDSIELPVFVFSNQDDESLISVFAFSYGFLQDHADKIALSRGTLRHIQETAQFDIHEMEETSVVIWRDRDDIFAAFVNENGSDFQARIMGRS